MPRSIASCHVSSCRRRPSRSTDACAARNFCSASTARSACRSWTNANNAFTTMTVAIAQPSTTLPVTTANAVAAHSNSASGWVNWRTSWRTHELRVAR